jgi:hypothetical protein
LEQALGDSLATVKSPKSTAFPIVNIVTYAIVFVYDGEVPPLKTPRVLEEHPELEAVAVNKSPKSCAFPRVAIVIKSIVFTCEGVRPPANKPLNALEQEELFTLLV